MRAYIESKPRSPVSTPPRVVWKHQPYPRIDDWLALIEPARCERAPPANFEVPPHPGRMRHLPPQVIHVSIHLQLLQLGEKLKTVIFRVETAPHGVKTPPPPTNCCLAGAHEDRAARVAPRTDVDVLRHPQRIRSHPGS